MTFTIYESTRVWTRTWALPADNQAPRRARQHLDRVLPAVTCPDETTAQLQLLVSELVTNALQAHAAAPAAPLAGAGPELWVGLPPEHQELTLAVFDGCPGHLPRLADQRPCELAESGRGLAIVEALTRGRWGVQRASSQCSPTPLAGKIVWAIPHVPALAAS
ncbi:ATP-binding protein [Actinomadura viridis]|uniref:ATP-binding protein n=1 Tax=Actinomadura viridis TaxID=58110 RepID=UPI00368AE5D5